MTDPVKDLKEYLLAVDAIVAAWEKRWPRTSRVPWFRGHDRRSNRPPEPTLLRGRYEGIAGEYEKKAGWEFKKRARPFIQHWASMEPQHRQIEWLLLMRHHGMPTRLLDWTESPLVALYFAVRPDGTGASVDEGHGCCVWVMNESWMRARAARTSGNGNLDAALLGLTSLGNEGSREQAPIPYSPPHLDARITAQRACFTVHPLFAGWLDRARAELDGGEVAIREIVIPTESISDIRKELHVAGISEATLFPDLDGIALDLAHRDLSTLNSWPAER